MTRALALAALIALAAGCENDMDIDTGPACRELEPEVHENVETWVVTSCTEVEIDGCTHCEVVTPFIGGPATWTVPGSCDVFEVCAALGDGS